MLKALFLPLLLPCAALAQSHDHAGHMAPAARPTEGGQAAFAAMAEIVALLSADPETDWSAVDLPALRQHLRDMDDLMMDVEVTQEPIPHGLRMTVEKTAPAADAALRMVPAHAHILEAETGWTVLTRQSDTQLVWEVTSPEDADRIRGLGFFGLMATGNHHPAHHLAIARGAPMH